MFDVNKTDNKINTVRTSDNERVSNDFVEFGRCSRTDRSN